MIYKFKDFINEELDFKMKPTDFTIIKIDPFYYGNNDEIYRFITNSGNSYDVYFVKTIEQNYSLSNGKKIDEYVNNLIVTTIFFSLTNRGLDPKTFNELTNNKEIYEVMSKVIYLIYRYDIGNKFNIYSIGGFDSKKYNLYSKYLNNLPNLKILEGKSEYYKNAYYLVR